MEDLMRQAPLLLLGALMGAPLAAQGPHNTLTDAERAAGWTLLFDGTTTKGWRNYRADSLSSGWQAVDGTLTRVRRGGDIITTEQFTNFEMMLEWRLNTDGPAGNSGIFYRASEEPQVIYMGAAEMQILDNDRHPDGRSELTSSGANYALHGVAHSHTRPVGEWNSVRIIANGNHIEHWFNGQKVVEFELDSPEWKALVEASKFKDWPLYARARTGHIGLQEHGSVVAFRNIKIRRLP
jgi:hypothetical protein